MNSYFASVEQQANPHLRGRPVGVCEHLGGLIIAPSVEAKRLGIKLGTPVWEALRTCPHIALLPTDPPKYRSVTEAFNRILADYTDCVERYSIDESFVDISECCAGDWNDALLIGLQIKQRLRREVGEWVSCSIGIGPNKLVAKIAADLDGGVIFHNSSPPPLILRGGVKIAPSLKVREGGPPRPTSERVEAGGELLPSLIFIGAAETFGETEKKVEAHILDWHGDLYGKNLEVQIIKKIRDNKKFSSKESLIEQMKKDETNAKQYFKL